ncbi:hypothetical protein MBLNU13_g06506t1 [Cladosporium sp. NU13]
MPLRLAIIAVLAVSKAMASDNCFWRSKNHINAMDDGWFACNNTQVVNGRAQLCCIKGSQCGQDSICLQNVNYYVGGCTDGTYGDPVCRTSCTSDSATWIQWNANTEVWECCGDAGCDGSPPSETFSAIARASWSPVKTAPQPSTISRGPSSTTASTTSTTSANTNSALPDESSEQSGGTSLSTGAQAGIGVACGLFGLAAVLAIGLLMIKKHKKRRGMRNQVQEEEHRLPDAESTAPPMANKYVPPGGLGSPQPHEIMPQPKPELSADSTARVELEGDREGAAK